jgi:hypothetical protein
MFWKKRARLMLELWGKEENPQRVFATDIKASEFKCFLFHQKTTLVRKVAKKIWFILIMLVCHNKTWETRKDVLLKLDRDGDPQGNNVWTSTLFANPAIMYGIFLEDSWYKCWAYYAIQLPTANDLPYGDKSVRSYCLTHGLPYIIVLGNMLVPYYNSFTA